eukprot:m.118512 g.118512  ORF g.118512 m.118512 type:complete len:314 (+) comp16124_c0_seq3:6176-7117(+)
MRAREATAVAVFAVLAAMAAVCVAQDMSCQLNSDGKTFDLSPLRKGPNPSGNMENSNYVVQQQAHDGDTDSDSYTYYLNICAAVVNDNGNTGCVQYKTRDPQGNPIAPVRKVTGGYSGSLVKSLNAGDLRYEYGPGDPHSARCNNASRTTVIILLCEDVGLGSPIFAGEANCGAYTFVWASCAACPVGSAIRNACPSQLPCSSSSKKLSGGSILLIIFFSLLSAYLLFGVLYNRWVHGAKGMEQVPNREFWSETWSNAKAGCSYIFSCSGTSGGTSVSASKPSTSIKYQGMMTDEKAEEALDADLDAEEDLYG